MSGTEQAVFWSEAVHTGVLRLVTGIPPPSDGPVTLRALLSADLRTSPDSLHLLLRSIDPSLQVILDAGSDPDGPLAALVPLGPDGLDRLAALDRLLRHLHGYTVPPSPRLTLHQRRRLKAMLRSIDGREEGASQREIAEAIFGVRRVGDDPWKTSPLRDVIRGLLRDGTAMIAGGYRKLLRGRRR